MRENLYSRPACASAQFEGLINLKEALKHTCLVKTQILCATVLPARSDSDVMFVYNY